MLIGNCSEEISLKAMQKLLKGAGTFCLSFASAIGAYSAGNVISVQPHNNAASLVVVMASSEEAQKAAELPSLQYKGQSLTIGLELGLGS